MEETKPRPQLFSNRALVSLTVPIILDALLAIIAGMADSAMVSSAGESAMLRSMGKNRQAVMPRLPLTCAMSLVMPH